MFGEQLETISAGAGNLADSVASGGAVTERLKARNRGKPTLGTCGRGSSVGKAT